MDTVQINKGIINQPQSRTFKETSHPQMFSTNTLYEVWKFSQLWIWRWRSAGMKHLVLYEKAAGTAEAHEM